MSSQDQVAEGQTVNRDNYMHMTGDALLQYAYTIGISRSEAAVMSEEKLKLQCRMRISRIYEEDPR
ncbi:MAG: hypothetical protein IV107_16345 [Paucibacter sp.]|nr:hypothetical protein [Roseateles sp.]